jgi:hypothetical protein
MFRTATLAEHLTDRAEITQLGDADFVAYQRQLEDTRPQPTAAAGGASFDVTPPF